MNSRAELLEAIATPWAPASAELRPGWMKVTPLPVVVKDNFRRHACTVIPTDAAPDSEPMTVWFDLPLSAPDDWRQTDAEPFLLMTLMQAMHEDRDLLVEGEVSHTLLANLEDFMAVFVSAKPHLYRRIAVHATTVVVPDRVTVRPPASAVVAFSGGVDSSFTVWRHHRREAGQRSRHIVAALMVHGFDIRLDQQADFDLACANARRVLDTIGLSLHAMRTNVRHFLTCSWNDSHGTAIAACQQFYKSIAGTGLIASSAGYDHLTIPWGTSALNDHLLSSDTLRLVHDGADFDRGAKIKAISNWPAGCDALRVCYEPNTAHGANCMRCEKCTRTLALFAVQDLPIPLSLGGDVRLMDTLLWRTRLRSRVAFLEWKQIERLVPPGHRWRPALRWLFAAYRLRAAWMPVRNGVRSMWHPQTAHERRRADSGH